MANRPALRAALLALALAAVAVPALAMRPSVPMLELGRQQIVSIDDQPLTASTMRKAIIYGGITRRWTAVAEEPGQLTLEASNGEHRVVVDIGYDDKGYEIRYKSSVEMEFADTDGKKTIHPKYNQWVRDLSTAIRQAVRTRNGERY